MPNRPVDYDAPLLRLAWDFKAQALAREERATAALTKRWVAAWRRISLDLADLITQIERDRLAGTLPTRGRLYRQEQSQALLRQIRAELDELTGDADRVIRDAQADEVTAALEDAPRLALAAAGDETVTQRLAAQWTHVPADALTMLTGTLQPGTPLNALLGELGTATAAGISERLTSGLAVGRNPRGIARGIRDDWGIGLNRALRISRTEILRSYRAANLYQYQQNGHIIKGWRWVASFSSRTCFPAGTMVQTIIGERPIEQINSGEQVLTHRGRWRRVTEALSYTYEGPMTEIITESGSLVATGDHPVLIRRDGDYYWMPAHLCQPGDELLRAKDRKIENLTHGTVGFTVERQVGDANDPVARRNQALDLALVGIRSTMPVRAVDLKGGIKQGQVEIDGVAVNRRLLHEVQSHSFKAEADVALWRSFARKATVAMNGAKLLARHCWDDAKVPPAVLAYVDLGRATASLRTVATSIVAFAKQRAARLAWDVLRLARALLAAIDAACAGVGLKNLAAGRASLLDLSFVGGSATGTGAVGLIAPVGNDGERPAAMFASLDNSWSAVRWVDPLSGESAFGGAELSSTGSVTWGLRKTLTTDATHQRYLTVEGPAEVDLATLRATVMQTPLPPIGAGDEGVTTADGTGCLDLRWLALDANRFHGTRITHVVSHNKRSIKVYNLEVVDDHTFIADGFVVHNCIACLLQHGKVFPTSVPMASHVQCRCAPVPVTASWRELGIDLDDPEPPIREGDGWRWFLKTAPQTQRRILGDRVYDLWTSGLIGPEQMWHVDHDPVWGDAIVASSVRQARTRQ